MAKIIKLTQNEIDGIRRDFEQALSLMKLSDGKLNFTKTFDTINRKATVVFTAEAWAKMQGLVEDYNKEVAWHGVAERGDDPSKDEYIVSDILVYPQTVSGATVEMDEAEYAKWISANGDDDRFYNIHMQGHSHVNMGVTPSSVDLQHYDDILHMLGDRSFYIFMILNKRGDTTVKVYDMAKNIMFDTLDCTVTALEPDAPECGVFNGLSEEEQIAAAKYIAGLRQQKNVESFIEESKKMVKEKTYGTAYCQSSGAAVGTSALTPVAKKEPTAKEPAAPVRKGKRKKGKRREENKSYLQSSFYDDVYDGDDYYNFWR